MKTKTITVSGGFHNARDISIRAKIDPRGGIQLSSGQVKKIEKHMCGIKGCVCGMHHGWYVDGCDLGELEEAFISAHINS